MKLDFRQAIMDDAGLLVDIYNASFFSDYQRFGICPGYGKTIEMMEESMPFLFSSVQKKVPKSLTF